MQIIPFDDRHQPMFNTLNRQWLDQYHLTEARDLEVLDHPREEIIDRGGAIFIAQSDGVVIGSAALLREREGTYELAKMCVAANFRQQGISKLLLEACLHHARQSNATKLVLFSNHQLREALALYEKYGFRYVEVVDSPFKTADIKMEKDL